LALGAPPKPGGSSLTRPGSASVAVCPLAMAVPGLDRLHVRPYPAE